MKLTVNDVSLYVEQAGSSAQPSLVFLHYWGGTHRTWSQVIAALGEDFHTVAFDSPGWGQSGASPRGYTIHAQAELTQALLDTLGLERYILVGHSMGGKVAQLVASRRPRGLAGLVLVAPATPVPSLMPEEAKQQQLHAYDNRETALQSIRVLTARMPGAQTVAQIVEDSLSAIAEAKLVWPTIGMAEDISAEVGRISAPTLLLAGELDQVDSIEQHRREVIARIPDAALRIIPGAGHLLPIDAPVVVAQEIASFAKAVDLAQRVAAEK
ncbi:alpha/beta fold hydrolase [Silvibacterium sp.]|uniref:alpha/beta fold hydrolase n=1 Tax=Silvibacterium sp. TaxID=1964179 RepID=UPI0039E428B8